MNKKFRYSLILIVTIISLCTTVYSKTTFAETYKTKSNAILVEENDKEGILSVFNVFKEKSELPKYLIPVGNTVGIKINTDGILVLGTGYINTSDGSLVIPAKDKIFAGDIIYKVNDEVIQTKEQLAEITSNSEDVKVVLNRNNEVMEVNVHAKKSITDGKYKLGLWVRDTTQGIGTISFINPETNEYYALGHGILDVDTKGLMAVKDGDVLACNITSINKGAEGTPGEIVGEIRVGKSIGDVKANTETGVKGNISNYDNLNITSEKLPVCPKEEIKLGEAYILSNVQNGEVQKYKVNISQINKDSIGNKNMIVEIVDEKLLSKTSGIVQGMSGSPIIQEGKVIGAITHVFVNNPKKGYGVFVENMVSDSGL